MKPRSLAPCLLSGLCLCGCANTKHLATGALAGERIESKVDSAEAAYYLRSYLAGRRENPPLDARIDRLHAAAAADRPPNRDELIAISREFSTDFAALFFADRVTRDAQNARAHAMFSRYLENPADGATVLARSYPGYVVLFAPGWDYISNGPVTGADFAQPRRLISQLGIENQLIAIDPHGSVEENAKEIRQAVERASGSGKKVIVVSASSAGPAVHVALDVTNVRGKCAPVAWINLGGILQGTPLVETIQKFPFSVVFHTYTWMKGWKESAIESMSATRCRARFPNLTVPKDTLVLTYVGLSLSGSLSKFARDKYSILKKDGPNDGLTPLADIIAPNSVTLIAPGSDHFFAEDPRINQKTVALAKTVIALLEERSVTISAAVRP